MKQFIAILVFATGLAYQVHAQSFLNDLQKSNNGEGTLTVKQSADIDELVNNANLKASSNAATQKKKEESATNSDSSRDNDKKQTTDERRHQRNTDGDSADSDHPLDTGKKVMRGSHKVTGYRIQAFSGGNTKADKMKANQIGDAIKMKFPDQPVYVHFYSPRWICRVGNFRSYAEAQQLLKSVKAMGYPQACIVKGKVSVGY